MQSRVTSYKGIGIIEALTFIFIILKLTNVVSWPWRWVLAPVWITICLAIVLFGAVMISGRLVKGKW